VPIAEFVVGAISAALCVLANHTQHGYYRNTRDRKNELEERLELGSFKLATTQGMGGIRARFGRVTTFQQLILVVLLAGDITGLVVSISHAARTASPPNVAVAARVVIEHGNKSLTIPLVFSRASHISATTLVHPGEEVLLRLPPGRYQASTINTRLCSTSVMVTNAPLQSTVIRCP
jgi:hypothetical protein